MRYFRAFWTALQITLRGSRRPDAELWEWVEQASRLVDAVMKVADSQRPDAADLKTVKVRLDGRTTSAEIVLATIRHHMNEEYPYLLRHKTRNHISAIHASNLNDVYRLTGLIDLPVLQDAAIQQLLTNLKTHLEKIPPQSSQ